MQSFLFFRNSTLDNFSNIEIKNFSYKYYLLNLFCFYMFVTTKIKLFLARFFQKTHVISLRFFNYSFNLNLFVL